MEGRRKVTRLIAAITRWWRGESAHLVSAVTPSPIVGKTSVGHRGLVVILERRWSVAWIKNAITNYTKLQIIQQTIANYTNIYKKQSVYPREGNLDALSKQRGSKRPRRRAAGSFVSLGAGTKEERPRGGLTYVKFRAKNSCVRDVGRGKPRGYLASIRLR